MAPQPKQNFPALPNSGQNEVSWHGSVAPNYGTRKRRLVFYLSHSSNQDNYRKIP